MLWHQRKTVDQENIIFNSKIKSLLHSVLPLFHSGQQALEKGHSPRNVATQTPLNMHGEDFQPAVQGVTCPGSVNNSNCAYNFLCVALKIHPTVFSSMSSNSAVIYYSLRVETRTLKLQNGNGPLCSPHFFQNSSVKGRSKDQVLRQSRSASLKDAANPVW